MKEVFEAMLFFIAIITVVFVVATIISFVVMRTSDSNYNKCLDSGISKQDCYKLVYTNGK